MESQFSTLRLIDLKKQHYTNLEDGIINKPLIKKIILKRLEYDYRTGKIHWENKIKRYLALDSDKLKPILQELIHEGKIQVRKITKKIYKKLPYAQINFYYLRKARHAVKAKIYQFIKDLDTQRRKAYHVGHHLEKLVAQRTGAKRGAKKIDIDGQTFLAECKNYINGVVWSDVERQIQYLRTKSDNVALIVSHATKGLKEKCKYYKIKLLELKRQIYKKHFGPTLPGIFTEDRRLLNNERIKAGFLWYWFKIKDYQVVRCRRTRKEVYLKKCLKWAMKCGACYKPERYVMEKPRGVINGHLS